jgi:hypothetical protein
MGGWDWKGLRGSFRVSSCLAVWDLGEEFQVVLGFLTREVAVAAEMEDALEEGHAFALQDAIPPFNHSRQSGDGIDEGVLRGKRDEVVCSRVGCHGLVYLRAVF